MESKYSIHFITYGNEKFASAKARILKEATEFGEFKTITGYGPENLPKEFVKKFYHILQQSRGGGYWIWKPMIILDKLEKINDGDILIYIDSGCTLNNKGKKRFFEYVDILNNSNTGLLSFQMDGSNGPGGYHKELEYTLSEVFNYFNISPDSKIGISGQYFGYTPYPYPLSYLVSSCIVKVFSPMLTHAYAVSRKGMKKILALKQQYDNNPIQYDKFLAYSNLSKYAIFPSINFQNIDPKLYRNALYLLNCPNIPYYYISRFIEYFSIIFPIAIIIIIISIVIHKRLILY